MEQENTKHDLATFTHELTPEYIKAKVEKVVSCSSGHDRFCELFDYDHNKITADDLIQRHYHIPIKDAESGTFSEEQEKEQELALLDKCSPFLFIRINTLKKRNKEYQTRILIILVIIVAIGQITKTTMNATLY